jgi:DNA uptake protein ComE-like DNA-binding protein
MKLVRLITTLLAAAGLMLAADAAAAAKANKAEAKKMAAKSAPAKTGALLDINTASEKELRELPGVGEAYSAKIMAGRPYKAKNQLVDQKIIPQATYDKIKDLIIARQTGGVGKAADSKKQPGKKK